MQLTTLETAILNRIQKDIALSHDIFSHIASDVGFEKKQVLETVTDLKEKGIIRNIAGIFNAASLGYKSSLVAFRVPEKQLEKAASVINGHPGVSHNYLRDNDYNIWFTLSIPPDMDFEKTVNTLAVQSGVLDSLILHNEKLYKIGLMLSIGSKNFDKEQHTHEQNKHVEKINLTEKDQEAVRLLQTDLPLVEYPFEKIIRNHQTNLTEHELISIGTTLKEKGIMRRYSAVLRHHKAGYKSNAMSVWRPESQEQLDNAVERFKHEPAISHLYLRTIYPGKWEYPLFAMIHAQSDDELKNIIAELARDSGIKDYRVLHSIREYKKMRVQYYSDEFNLWNERNFA